MPLDKVPAVCVDPYCVEPGVNGAAVFIILIAVDKAVYFKHEQLGALSFKSLFCYCFIQITRHRRIAY